MRFVGLTPAANAFYREYGDRIALTEETQTLPDMRGSGAVRDIREAVNDLDWKRTARVSRFCD